MKNKRSQITKQVKKNAKFSGFLLLWAIPVIIGMSILCEHFGLPTWLSIMINIIAGGATCFFVYVIWEKIKEKKEKEPKKPDPFSD